MTLAAKVEASVQARRTQQSGLAVSVEEHPVSFAVAIGDCTKVWSDRRTFGSPGFDEVDFATIGIDSVKLLCINNLSETSAIALSAGLSSGQFRIFRQDTTSWNFSPMINLGSLTMRGYPIRERGSFLLSCPNSLGFGTTAGGSILRIGGSQGESYEIYVLGS